MNLLSLKEAFLLPAITRGRENLFPSRILRLTYKRCLPGRAFESLSTAPDFFFPVVLVGRKKKRRAVKHRCLARSLMLMITVSTG
jgi:hypothetical protein